MIKFLFSLIVFLSPISLMANHSRVNFLNWADYIDPQTIPQFERTTSIKVYQSYFDGADMLKAKLFAGSTNIDLTMPALGDMPHLIAAGTLQPIDTSRIPNYKLRSTALYNITNAIDPQHVYGLIYSYGTTGVAYNPELVKQALGDLPLPDNLWDLLFKPKYLKRLKSCGVSYLDSPVQVFGTTLFYLNLDPNSVRPEDYQQATQSLLRNRQYLTYFDNNRYIQDLASGNICIAMAYSGDTIRAKMLAKRAGSPINIQYALPKTGGPIWFDMLAIPTGAPNLDSTYTFINYLLSPKVAAQTSNYLYQPNAVPASEPYLDPVLKDSSLTPKAAKMLQLFNIEQPHGEINTLENQLWFQVKYGVKLT